MSWDDWALGVLQGLVAPADAVNLDTLQAWSNAESGADLMRWNNPLNTTEELIYGVDIDPDMNRVGVEAYPTVQDGVIATVATLLNGFYPTIVSHIRHSVPRAQWGDACGELGKWGTGCGWLNADYGPAPSGPPPQGGLFMAALTDQQQSDLLAYAKQAADHLDTFFGLFEEGPDGADWNKPDGTSGPWKAKLQEKFAALLAKSGSLVVDETAVLAAIADLKAHPDPTAAAIGARIENALKTA